VFWHKFDAAVQQIYRNRGVGAPRCSKTARHESLTGVYR